MPKAKKNKTKSKKDIENETPKNKNTPKKSTEKVTENRPPKFRFECQKCGNCCKNVTIYISINDLDRWVADNSVYRVMHLLQLDETTDEVKMTLRKDDDGYCNLYHRDSKTCTLYTSRPLTCRAFPLGFNGENYILKSKDCPGLNQGAMTKEQLKSMRDDATGEFESNEQSNRVLRLIQSLIMTKLIEQSKEFMEQMSDAGTEDDIDSTTNENQTGTQPKSSSKEDD